jgi:chromosome segregation ATPase
MAEALTLEARVERLERNAKDTEDAVSAHFVEFRAFFEETLRPLAGRIDFLEKRMDRVEKRMDGLEKRMDGLERRMDGLERRMGALEIGFGRLESKLDLFIATQGGINRRVDRELRALTRNRSTR